MGQAGTAGKLNPILLLSMAATAAAPLITFTREVSWGEKDRGIDLETTAQVARIMSLFEPIFLDQIENDEHDSLNVPQLFMPANELPISGCGAQLAMPAAAPDAASRVPNMITVVTGCVAPLILERQRQLASLCSRTEFLPPLLEPTRVEGMKWQTFGMTTTGNTQGNQRRKYSRTV